MRQSWCLGSNSLKHIFNKAVHNAYNFAGDIGLHLLQHFVNSSFLPLFLSLNVLPGLFDNLSAQLIIKLAALVHRTEWYKSFYNELHSITEFFSEHHKCVAFQRVPLSHQRKTFSPIEQLQPPSVSGKYLSASFDASTIAYYINIRSAEASMESSWDYWCPFGRVVHLHIPRGKALSLEGTENAESSGRRACQYPIQSCFRNSYGNEAPSIGGIHSACEIRRYACQISPCWNRAIYVDV